MRSARLALLAPVLACAAYGSPFNPAGWSGYRTLVVSETAGIARDKDPVDVSFSVPLAAPAAGASLRIAAEAEGGLIEVPAQFYTMGSGNGGNLSGKVVFLCAIPAGGQKAFRLYYGNPGAGMGSPEGGIFVRPAPKGPIEGSMHWIIENAFYRIETYPKNGQIWHIWDKKGTNTMWWYKEWNGPEKGGDPIHWSPNIWIAYPDRAGPAPGVRNVGSPGGDKLLAEPEHKVFAQPWDWHYVMGWENPKTEIIQGPLFWQIRRWGPVSPHPEHSDPTYERPAKDLVWAEVTYRFYRDLPWFFQSSTLTTLADMDVYFVRNNQMVFRDTIFSHLAIQPETAGLMPGDRDETCILPLKAYFDRAPFPREWHSLSNALPSTFGYYTLFNATNGDGYANFPLSERNSTITGAPPTLMNHHMSLNEGHDWSVYLARTFDYTNHRFDPENATFLPAGQRFMEENAHMVYRYDGLKSLAELDHWNAVLRHPLAAHWSPAPEDGSVVWSLEDPHSVGGRQAVVIGSPKVIREAGGAAVRFDGEADGWIVETNPLAGLSSFTVEVLLRPAVDGGSEQRFIHLEDNAGRRMMLETRLTAERTWALDSFLTDGVNSGMLLDRKLQHTAGQWHWAALVYDQGQMTNYVDGRQQLTIRVALSPMIEGKVGIGFRMNRVFWYHGDIREIRFHPKALPADQLAHNLPR